MVVGVEAQPLARDEVDPDVGGGQDLAGEFQKIGKELRSQYSLAYVSTNSAHDGTFRKITIKTDKKGLRVQAKTGYFAPSQ